MIGADWFTVGLGVAAAWAMILAILRQMKIDRLEWQVKLQISERRFAEYVADHRGEIIAAQAEARSEATRKGNFTRARNLAAKRDAKTAHLAAGVE